MNKAKKCRYKSGRTLAAWLKARLKSYQAKHSMSAIQSKSWRVI